MEEKKYRILIIDDDEHLCEILQFNLEGEGFLTDIAYSAAKVLKKKNIGMYDMILLDVMMDKMSGFTFAKKIRKKMKFKKIPIIFITAKDTENDLLTGFSLGADDYITKPFSVKEVIARVKAVLNRNFEEKIKKTSIIFDKLELNIDKKFLKIRDEEIKLTKKEFEILTLLLKNQGSIFSRGKILNNVWTNEVIVSDKTIDVHIARLRKKLMEYGKFIQTKQGYGYVFNNNEINT